MAARTSWSIRAGPFGRGEFPSLAPDENAVVENVMVASEDHAQPELKPALTVNYIERAREALFHAQMR
jgi:hypothetical protein